MLKYSSYLLKNILRKWTVWVLLSIYVIVSFVIVYVQIHEVNKMSVPFVEMVNTYTKMIPFIFGVSFISLIVVYAFKEGEDDGTELMIVSKPLSRWQILMGKFLMVLLGIVLFTLVSFLAYFSIAHTDKYASNSDILRFSGSIAIGGLVVLAIASTVIMLISSFLNKVGTVALGVVSAAVIPISSTIVSAVSYGVPPSNLHLSGYMKLVNQKQVDEKLRENIQEYIKTGKSELDIASFIEVDQKNYQPYNEKRADKFEEYKDRLWYDKIVYGDVWYQWNTFYSMFSNKNSTNIGETFKVTTRKETVSIPKDMEMDTINGKRVAVSIELSSKLNMETVENALFDIFVKNVKLNIITEPVRSEVRKIRTGQITQFDLPSVSVLDLFTKTSIPNYYNGKPLTVSFEDRMRAIIELNDFRKNSFENSLDYLSLNEYIIWKAVHTILNPTLNIDSYIPLLIDAGNRQGIPVTEAEIRTIFNALPKQVSPTKIYGYTDQAYKAHINNDNNLSSGEKESELKIFTDYSAAGILVDGSERYIIHNNRFVSKSKTMLIWSIIGALLLALTIFRYFRRDFK